MISISQAMSGEAIVLLDKIFQSISEARVGHLARSDFSNDIRVFGERIKKVVPDTSLASATPNTRGKASTQYHLHAWLDELIALASVPETEQPLTQTARTVGRFFGEMALTLRTTQIIQESLDVRLSPVNDQPWLAYAPQETYVAVKAG